MLKRLSAKLNRAAYLHNPNSYWSKIKSSREYKKSLALLQINRGSDTKLAVVIHLFYMESWPTFQQKLEKINNEPFDLFITLPAKNLKFTNIIKRDFPHAYLIIVPNHGRDILPFFKLVPFLLKAQYTYVLKLHSKRSAHRKDGTEWLNDMVENLIPNSITIRRDIFRILNKQNTGIIGPKGQYLQLSVNFEANGMHMTEVLSRLYDKKTSHKFLQKNRLDYGFFAGSMFWARIDSLIPLIKYKLSIYNYEVEKGQIDATLAHAIERLISVIMEIEKRDLYEVDSRGVHRIAYKTDHVPDWSKVYIGPSST